MHSSLQLFTLSLLPLAVTALPQPQDGWSSGNGGSWAAGGDSSGGAAAGGDSWEASPTPNAWDVPYSPAGGYAAVTTAAPAVQSVWDPNAWATQVTWPAGCETWANPCPSGAPIVGGGAYTGAPVSSAVAVSEASGASSIPYTNAYTSFLTQTNSGGVVTGMPSQVTSQPDVATVPAGVETGSAASAPPSSTPSGGFPTIGGGSNGTSGANPSISGFDQTPSNGAADRRASALVCALTGLLALLL